MRTDKQILHDKALGSLRSRMRVAGISCHVMPETNSHYDLHLSNGLKVEVKAARRRQGGKREVSLSWCFNLHRHGQLDSRPLDFYALYCELPTYGIWLIVPQKEIAGVLTLHINWRSMARTYGQWERRFDLLTNKCQS